MVWDAVFIILGFGGLVLAFPGLRGFLASAFKLVGAFGFIAACIAAEVGLFAWLILARPFR